LIQTLFVARERDHAAAKGEGDEQEDQFLHSPPFTSVGRIWEELKSGERNWHILSQTRNAAPSPCRSRLALAVISHVQARTLWTTQLSNSVGELPGELVAVRYSSGASERRAFS
jgi:hypothetical protein